MRTAEVSKLVGKGCNLLLRVIGDKGAPPARQLLLHHSACGVVPVCQVIAARKVRNKTLITK